MFLQNSVGSFVTSAGFLHARAHCLDRGLKSNRDSWRLRALRLKIEVNKKSPTKYMRLLELEG